MFKSVVMRYLCMSRALHEITVAGKEEKIEGYKEVDFFFINKKQERRNERESEQCGLCLIFFVSVANPCHFLLEI